MQTVILPSSERPQGEQEEKSVVKLHSEGSVCVLMWEKASRFMEMTIAQALQLCFVLSLGIKLPALLNTPSY